MSSLWLPYARFLPVLVTFTSSLDTSSTEVFSISLRVVEIFCWMVVSGGGLMSTYQQGLVNESENLSGMNVRRASIWSWMNPSCLSERVPRHNSRWVWINDSLSISVIWVELESWCVLWYYVIISFFYCNYQLYRHHSFQLSVSRPALELTRRIEFLDCVHSSFK